MLITLASNWNLTGGFTGYIDFGHAVFFGLGAYGTGIFMQQMGINAASLNEGFSVAFLPILGGAIVAAIFALGIGSATLRLKGPYFSISMLGTFYAMREIIRVSRPLTGGGQGLMLPPFLDRELFYYLTLGLAIFVVTMIWLIRRSEFGASLVAIREDEIGAEMRGINTTMHKITAFMIAAFFGGIVGGLWAIQNTFIDPDIVFFESRTVDLVMMTMLGGLGTVAGPVIGVTVLYWLRDVIWSNFSDWHLAIQGVLLIIIVLFVPEGIMGILGNPNATSLGRMWKRVTQGNDIEDAYDETESIHKMPEESL
jgi:branched-chain amino acid transport system permease protein